MLINRSHTYLHQKAACQPYGIRWVFGKTLA